MAFLFSRPAIVVPPVLRVSVPSRSPGSNLLRKTSSLEKREDSISSLGGVSPRPHPLSAREVALRIRSGSAPLVVGASPIHPSFGTTSRRSCYALAYRLGGRRGTLPAAARRRRLCRNRRRRRARPGCLVSAPSQLRLSVSSVCAGLRRGRDQSRSARARSCHSDRGRGKGRLSGLHP